MTIHGIASNPFRASSHLLRATILLVLSLSLTLGLRASATPASSAPSILPFRFVKGFAVVVPVYFNGSGPFDLMLDTGSSGTTVDRELARSLQLPAHGKGTVTTLVRSSPTSVTEARTVSIGPVTEPNVEVIVRDLDALRRMDPHIRGVLGQNVLKHADYLLDYQHRQIEFDSDGRLLVSLSGKRTPVVKLPVLDNPDYFILVLRTNIVDIGVQSRTFILDSGSASLVLFTDRATFNLSPPHADVQDDGGQRLTVPLRSVQLRFSGRSLQVPAHAVVFPAEATGFDSLLPTSLFTQLYISGTGSFVLFNPKRMPHRGSSSPPLILAQTNTPEICERISIACKPISAQDAANHFDIPVGAPSAAAATQLLLQR